MAVLLLHAVDNPVPDWFRSGALPLLVGGILAGLAFAYYARPAGGGAGVAVLLAGALVLIGGGLTRQPSAAPRIGRVQASRPRGRPCYTAPDAPAVPAGLTLMDIVAGG